MPDWYQWHGHPWPHKTEGNGHKIASEDYPHQGLDLNTAPYDYEWLWRARENANMGRNGMWNLPAFNAGGEKYPGRSPLGTSVAVLARQGHDMLASLCGECQRPITVCHCVYQFPGGES